MSRHSRKSWQKGGKTQHTLKKITFEKTPKTWHQNAMYFLLQHIHDMLTAVFIICD